MGLSGISPKVNKTLYYLLIRHMSGYKHERLYHSITATQFSNGPKSTSNVDETLQHRLQECTQKLAVATNLPEEMATWLNTSHHLPSKEMGQILIPKDEATKIQWASEVNALLAILAQKVNDRMRFSHLYLWLQIHVHLYAFRRCLRS